MATKFIGMRGIDVALYDDMVKIVLAKYGRRRGKHSNVAREINVLLRLYVDSEGDVVACTHTAPKDKILDEIDRQTMSGDLTRERLDSILDYNRIIDERTRDKYANYGNRAIERLVAAQLGVSVTELRDRKAGREGYR